MRFAKANETNPRKLSISPTTSWLRNLASYVDYSRFRRVWLHPITEQAEQGYLAACYERVAQRANSEGEYYLAYDAATHGLRCAIAAEFPPHVLISLKATALARSGATAEAKRLLEEFLERHEPDSSVCSAHARLFRDLGRAATDLPERRRLFKVAAEWAARAMNGAHDESGDWAYPANQEVQFRLLAGEHAIAQAKALAVIDFVERFPGPVPMWKETNLAEMHLVRGDLDKAGTHYQKAAQLGAESPGDLAASRLVAAVLLEELAKDRRIDPTLLDEWFPKPVVVVFAGHVPDAAHREAPRLPRDLCRAGGPVFQALAEALGEFKPIEGICASAPGGDILFAEALLSAKINLTLIDPFPHSRIEAVAAAYQEDWSERLARVFEGTVRSESITCAEDADETAQCEYATKVMIGSSILRAKRINASLHAIALWDQADAACPKRGGTGQFVASCQQAGIPVRIVNPLGVRTASGVVVPPSEHQAVCPAEPSESSSSNSIVIRSMLFADVVDFSKLPDAAYPGLADFFADADAVLSEHSAMVRNTWGDAIFAVFAEPRQAADAALMLQKRLKATDWATRLGLGPEHANIRLRIGLHAGPVHQGYDPITKSDSYTGRHTNLAARIEPIAEEGHVYASGEFAAMATVAGGGDFQFDYVGQRLLPKKAGIIPVFRLVPVPKN